MTENRIQSVIVNGQTVDLGGEYGVEEARSLIQDLGLGNVSNAKTHMVNPTTVEFVNEYGENGLA